MGGILTELVTSLQFLVTGRQVAILCLLGNLIHDNYFKTSGQWLLASLAVSEYRISGYWENGKINSSETEGRDGASNITLTGR